MVKKSKIVSVLNLLKPLAVVLTLVIALRYTGALSGVSSDTQKEESFNYDFTVRDLNERVIDFNQFKGKVVFLNIWATWCGPCRAEMPSIQNLYASVDTSRVKFVMLDWLETGPKVSKYVSKSGYTFPVYLVNGTVPDQLNVASIPTTFIIDKHGNIVTKKVGTANYDTDKFRKLLEELGRD